MNSNAELYKTVDGGINYQIINSPQLTNIQFINESIGFASGLGGLHKTIDGGITWVSDGCVNTDSGLSTFYFFNENIGFKKCANNLFKTSDGGVNFTIIDNSNFMNIKKLFAVSENVLWQIPVQCPLNGTPCFSVKGELSNNGSYQIGICQPFSSIYFANLTLGYAVSLFGDIFKNSTGNLGVNEIKKKSIFKIAPNPAINRINVSFKELQTENYKIEINDHLGKNIFTKSYNFENNITIDTQNLSKGFYFVTITSGKSKQTEKLIIN